VEEFTVLLSESDYFARPVAVGDAVTATWNGKEAHVLSS